jgi:excisionase family DNA binding protein
MENRLYTTQEAAKELGLDDSYLRRLLKKGKAQAKQQIGGTWVFSAEEIERLRNRPGKGKPGRPKKVG